MPVLDQRPLLLLNKGVDIPNTSVSVIYDAILKSSQTVKTTKITLSGGGGGEGGQEDVYIRTGV